uniref:Small ribosomal subunit protein mS23 n=1 Tax=Graphocephala atropunctata TaxID=36148 RepID=A0A1B6M1P3_9HEMI
MAQSRLEKIGTIFSRVSNLIRTGSMSMNDRPLWYDVYKAFPPAVPPKYDRPVPEVNIKPIFYRDDLIRAKFHKDMGRSLPGVNMTDTQYATVTQKMIQLCLDIQQKKRLDMEEAYQEAFHVIKTEELSKQTSRYQGEGSNLASTFKEALEKKMKSEPISLSVKDILSDK